MPQLTLDAEALARHENPPGSVPRLRRPIGYLIDDDGVSIPVDLPGPAYVAEMLTADGLELFRRSASIVARPTGSDVEPTPLNVLALAEGLRETLATLPSRPDAGQPYRDLRTAALAGSPRLAEYALTVVRTLRASLPAVPTRPMGLATAAPALTPTERKRAQRARNLAAEMASAEWWVDAYLNGDDYDDPAEPGARALAASLHKQARAAVEDFEGEPIEEDDPESLPARKPGRRVFYAVLTRRLGPPTHTMNGNAHTIPTREETQMKPMFTRTEVLAEVARQEREALASTYASETTPERDTLAPVVPLRVVA